MVLNGMQLMLSDKPDYDEMIDNKEKIKVHPNYLSHILLLKEGIH